MDRKYYLGVDLGSVSVDGVVVDEFKNVLWHTYQKVQGRSRDAVVSLCRELLSDFIIPQKVMSFHGAIATGSGKEIVQELLVINAVNEIVAHGAAAVNYTKTKVSVIEIGGQDSKFILVDDKGPYDYAMNELCAAGTGAFLDVQAERLGMTIEELSAKAKDSDSVPPMAGRCSVFAKSDIIHLQQRGVPEDQIVAGLCYALARNYVANLIRGRQIIKPVVFQGGVALNDGVLRAFKDILNLSDTEIIRPEMPHLAGAMGAAILASSSGSSIDAIAIELIVQTDKVSGGGENISTKSWKMNATAKRQSKDLEYLEVTSTIRPEEKLFIGMDIGSISTNAVVLSSDYTLLAKSYILTEGKPLDAAHKALSLLSDIINETDIAAVGVTGSGRKLVGHAIGADLVIDEITAQAKGARHGCKNADTIIEIGGQDAKFIRLGEDAAVLEFEMNKVCSAGTGSFIQEQAVRLGVDLKNEYSQLAISSKTPLPFTSRCTVFMESDLVHHIQQGVSLPDLLMGVSQAVVENYIDRVVQGRKIGQRVIIQGGVAKNSSVVKAFKAKLKGAEVVVHPHPGVSGAIGMAALTIEEYKKKTMANSAFKSSFTSMDFSTNYRFNSFECKSCENRCEVNVFRFNEGRFHFGDLCGKYSDALSGFEVGKDMTPDWNFLTEQLPLENPIARVLVPSAVLFFEFYPFWQKYFSELSIEMVVSGPSSSAKLFLALARLPAETCLPVKLLFGHVASLPKEASVPVLIPSLSRMLDGISCPYIQYGAAMVQSNFDGARVITLSLVPNLDKKEKLCLSLQVVKLFGTTKEKASLAYDRASTAFTIFQKDLKSATSNRSSNKPLAVLLGKPYNIGDRFVNMSLAAKLAKAGFDVVSDQQLAVPEDLSLPKHYDSITWAFSRRMLKISIWISGVEDIYPIVVGNFSCGPDSFTVPLLQEIFADRPSLFLEFDEHRADAGLTTRIEAFAHRVACWRDKPKIAYSKNNSENEGLPFRKSGHEQPPHLGGNPEYIIPYFSDHARAFASAFESQGVKARVLPLPDHNSYETGVEFSGGKQCHPFQLIAGDLINLARNDKLPKDAIYLLPIAETSCLISQYKPTIQQYMNRIGRADVKVISAKSTKLFDKFGPMFLFNLGKALLGIEYLSRLKFEMRPYELEKGSVDRVYFAALERIHQRQIEDKINQGIMEAAKMLDDVPTRSRGSKPVIAITGDVYTRVNPVANGNLFDLLEELGCEVWLSPTLVDVIMTGQEIRARQFWEAGKALDTMSSWGRVLVNNFGASYVTKHFEGRLSNIKEPDANEVLNYTEGLLPGEPELLVTLNVAKHVDFANKGVDGILNVYCLNCLIGTATTSIYKGLAERTAGVPMMPLVFDAMGGTHVKNRAEAFVHRVKRNREEKLAKGKTKTEPGTVNATHHVARLKELFDQKILEVKMPSMKLPKVKVPDIRLSAMKMPQMKIPNMRMPEGLWDWSKKKGTNEKKDPQDDQ